MHGINKHATEKQAQHLLSQYRMLINIAGSQGDVTGRRVNELATTIDRALSAITIPIYQDILVVRYQLGQSHNEAAKTVGLASRTFDRYQQRALLEFATLYSGSSLIVWSD